MKFTGLLPLAAATSAFVVPNEQVFRDVAIETHSKAESFYDKLPSKSDILGSIRDAVDGVNEATKNTFDEALDFATQSSQTAYDKVHEIGFDAEAWFQTAKDSFEDIEFDGPPHHGPGRRRPRDPHVKSNKTVYQLVSESKYTTKLAKLINDNEDLVDLLNGTSANFTIFAPTDRAFDKIPKHAPEPSPEQIKALLSYHVSSDFYPAGRVLKTHTIPTLLKSDSLGPKSLPQRLSINLGLRGLTVNFYSRIVAINVFGSNGVIHGVDSLILPPPRVVKIIDLLPSEFSTLELGLGKTGLLEQLNTTDHPGGTLFAPSNGAFRKLGPRINAFLFSQPGLKYLKALLEYHVAPANTLYSDAYYKADEDDEDAEARRSGYYHVDLPTLLTDGDDTRTLAVDITNYGPFIEIKVNAFSRVAVQDGIAKDGVIHVVSNVIIPPRKLQSKGSQDVEYQEWNHDNELTVEELKDRLAPYVEVTGDYDDERWDL